MVPVVVLSSMLGAVIGVFGLLVAERERRKGLAWWAWVLPGTFGVLQDRDRHLSALEFSSGERLA